MPVLRDLIVEPPDTVMQGSVIATQAAVAHALYMPVSMGPSIEPPPLVIMIDEDTPESWWPAEPALPDALLRTPLTAPMSNATISTPCGALVDTFMTGRPTLGAPPMSTTRWFISGVSRDASAQPLPSCRIVVLAVGALAVGGGPVEAETISSDVDGSFSLQVSGNGSYGIIAYKPGDPPTVAGITLFPLTPTAE